MLPPAGYLCVHVEKDESLGTTLILTWVPNSRIQRQDEEALRYITPESSPVRRNARRRGRRWGDSFRKMSWIHLNHFYASRPMTGKNRDSVFLSFHLWIHMSIFSPSPLREPLQIWHSVLKDEPIWFKSKVNIMVTLQNMFGDIWGCRNFSKMIRRNGGT